MLVYVGHKFGGDLSNVERARQITHDLQINDTANCYICPLLAFSHLDYNELGQEIEMELCLDFLSVADKLIVASGTKDSKGLKKEIEFANLVGMEVEYFDT